MDSSRITVATAGPNVSYCPPEVTVRTGSKRPRHSPKNDNESKPSRSNKRTRVLIDDDTKPRLIDRPLGEAFMWKPDKNITVCAKIRFDTLSEDRSDGKQSVLLYALQKAIPPAIPKALEFTTSMEKKFVDHINNAQGRKSGRKIRAEEMHERKSRFVELENIVTKFDSGRANSQVGDRSTSWGDNSQGIKDKTSAAVDARIDTSSVPSDYRLYDRFNRTVPADLHTDINLQFGSTASNVNLHRSHAVHQFKSLERHIKRSGSGGDFDSRNPASRTSLILNTVEQQLKAKKPAVQGSSGESNDPALQDRHLQLSWLEPQNKRLIMLARRGEHPNGSSDEESMPDLYITDRDVSPKSGDDEKRQGKAAPPGRCHSCNRAKTVKWLQGPDGARTLCYACGLHYAKLTRKMGINKAPVLTGSNRGRKGKGNYSCLAHSIAKN